MTVNKLSDIPDHFLDRKVRTVKITVKHAVLSHDYANEKKTLRSILPELIKEEEYARAIDIFVNGAALSVKPS